MLVVDAGLDQHVSGRHRLGVLRDQRRDCVGGRLINAPAVIARAIEFVSRCLLTLEHLPLSSIRPVRRSRARPPCALETRRSRWADRRTEAARPAARSVPRSSGAAASNPGQRPAARQERELGYHQDRPPASTTEDHAAVFVGKNSTPIGGRVFDIGGLSPSWPPRRARGGRPICRRRGFRRRRKQTRPG